MKEMQQKKDPALTHETRRINQLEKRYIQGAAKKRTGREVQFQKNELMFIYEIFRLHFYKNSFNIRYAEMEKTEIKSTCVNFTIL